MEPIPVEQKINEIVQKCMEKFEEHKAALKAHDDKLIADGADAKTVREMTERAVKRIEAMEARLGAPRGDGADAQPFEGKNLGELITGSDAMQEYARRALAKDGKTARSSAERFSIELKNLFAYDRKTTITEGAVGNSTPGILIPQRMAGIVKPGIRRVRVRDLMPRFQSTNNAVEYVKENVYSNAASPQVEASAKAESGLTFTIQAEYVRTLAHWIPASRQILDDFAQLQAYVNQRLIEGLKDVEDAQLLSGDGTGQNLKGIFTQAGAYDTGRNVSADTKIDTINHLISQIEDANLTATGIIISPTDWRAMQLIKTEEGGSNKGLYILGGPAGNAQPMLWGLPVAVTTAMPQGKVIVGAFEEYCAVWDRMDARVDISQDYSDFFVKNLIAIRAEERLCFTLTRNDAVIQGTFPS